MMSSGPLWKAAASLPDFGDLLLDALAAVGRADAAHGRGIVDRGRGARARPLAPRRGAGAAVGAGAAATGVAAASGAAAGGVCAPSVAGVSPIAARAIAHPINFIVIRPLSAWFCTATLGGLRKWRPYRADIPVPQAPLSRQVARWLRRPHGSPIPAPNRRGQAMTDDEILAEFRAAEALARGTFHPLVGPAQPALPAMRARVDGPAARVAAGRGARREASRRRPPVDRRRRSPAMGGVIIGHEMGRALGVPAMFVERPEGVFGLRRGFRLDPGRAC